MTSEIIEVKGLDGDVKTDELVKFPKIDFNNCEYVEMVYPPDSINKNLIEQMKKIEEGSGDDANVIQSKDSKEALLKSKPKQDETEMISIVIDEDEKEAEEAEDGEEADEEEGSEWGTEEEEEKTNFFIRFNKMIENFRNGFFRFVRRLTSRVFPTLPNFFNK